MKNKNLKNKNDYKSIAYQINNKKGNMNKELKQNKSDFNTSKELDKSAFVMVPINHPKINEIIKLLNEIDIKSKETYDVNNNSKENDNLKSENNFKLIITLNDILTNFKNGKVTIPENSIITPLARDYIAQKKIEIIYVNN